MRLAKICGPGSSASSNKELWTTVKRVLDAPRIRLVETDSFHLTKAIGIPLTQQHWFSSKPQTFVESSYLKIVIIYTGNDSAEGKLC